MLLKFSLLGRKGALYFLNFFSLARYGSGSVAMQMAGLDVSIFSLQVKDAVGLPFLFGTVLYCIWWWFHLEHVTMFSTACSFLWFWVGSFSLVGVNYAWLGVHVAGRSIKLSA